MRYPLFAILSTVAVFMGIAVASLPLNTLISTLLIAVLGTTVLISPYSALLAVLVLSPLRTLIATEGYWPFPIDVGLVLFAVFVARWALSWMWQAQAQPKRHWRITPVEIALVAFISIQFLSGLNASSLTMWVSETLKWTTMLVMALAVSRMPRLDVIISSLLVAGVTHAAVGVYTFLGGSGADHLALSGGFYRAFGTFGQPNPFAGFMGLLAPLSIAVMLGLLINAKNSYWLSRRQRNPQWILMLTIVAAALLSAAVFASWSRGSWMGFVSALMVMVVLWPRRIWQSAVMALLVIGGGWVIWSQSLLPASIEARIVSATAEIFVTTDIRGVDITPENYPIVERLAHWQAAISMVESNPWLGVGSGNFDAVYPEYGLLNWDQSLGHAHNFYLNVAAETGIIGLSVYFALIVSTYWILLHSRRHPDPFARSVVIGIIGAITYLLVHSLTDNLYVNNVFLHFGAILGVMITIYHQLMNHMDATSL